jgi:hypothetical protein
MRSAPCVVTGSLCGSTTPRRLRLAWHAPKPRRRPVALPRRLPTAWMHSVVPGGPVRPVKSPMFSDFVLPPPTQHGVEVGVELPQLQLLGDHPAHHSRAGIGQPMDGRGMVAFPKMFFEVGQGVAGRNGFYCSWGARQFLRRRAQARPAERRCGQHHPRSLPTAGKAAFVPSNGMHMASSFRLDPGEWIPSGWGHSTHAPCRRFKTAKDATNQGFAEIP